MDVSGGGLGTGAPSSSSRGEVEGSSTNNSPPASVIQGGGHHGLGLNLPPQDYNAWARPANVQPMDWVRASFKDATADAGGGGAKRESNQLLNRHN